MTRKPASTRSRVPIDFDVVERLRWQMRLTKAGMAKVLGVSRMTYYGWVAGKRLRPSSEDMLKKKISALLAVVTEDKWPTTEGEKMPASKVVRTVLALMAKHE
jgi:DNA-binding XRE family transcriptional regulator